MWFAGGEGNVGEAPRCSGANPEPVKDKRGEPWAGLLGDVLFCTFDIKST